MRDIVPATITEIVAASVVGTFAKKRRVVPLI